MRDLVDVSGTGVYSSAGEGIGEHGDRNLREPNDGPRTLESWHIAGTKGKGSVPPWPRPLLTSPTTASAFYTSPHLVDLEERFFVRRASRAAEARNGGP